MSFSCHFIIARASVLNALICTTVKITCWIIQVLVERLEENKPVHQILVLITYV